MPQTLWCSDVAHVTFEVAEACVSHRIGSAVAGPMPVRTLSPKVRGDSFLRHAEIAKNINRTRRSKADHKRFA